MTTTVRLILLGVLRLISIAIVVFMSPQPQDPGFHSFADTDTIASIPNFWNVISNIPFLLSGTYGLVLLKKTKVLGPPALIFLFLFIGILFTGIGSAYYHFEPIKDSIVFDRIPMTIVFMSFLSATIYEYISSKAGSWLLLPLVIMGIASVLWWRHTETLGAGDLRVYGFVQFYPVIFIPLIIFLFPAPDNSRVLKLFLAIVLWYIIAKFLERFDQEIFRLTRSISGHSLKHIAAAVSTWYIVQLFRRKFIRP